MKNMETISAHQRLLAQVTRFVIQATKQILVIKHEKNGSSLRVIYTLKDYTRFPPNSEMIIEISHAGKVKLTQATGFFNSFQKQIKDKLNEFSKERRHGGTKVE